MPRKRMDPLIAATIAHIPVQGPFPADAREAFFAMLRCAFDAVYGQVGVSPVVNAPSEFVPASIDTRYRQWTISGTAPAFSKVYTIDADGFAMCDGKPVKFLDPPIGSVLIDERSSDAGRPDTILWHDCGTRADGALPPGVTLRIAAESRQ